MSRASILAARQSFSDWGVWPRQRADIDPEGWLSNFDEGDQEVAEALLDAFVLFNADLTEQLFYSACRSLPGFGGSNAEDRVAAWKQFQAEALVTFPGEEDQNPTDSGHRFATIARNRLGFVESNIFRPADATRHLSGLDGRRPLLFVDDFVGTGAQFLDTWRERVVVAADRTSSFEDEVRRLGISETYLVVAIAAQKAVEELKEEAPEVTVVAAHVLPVQASVNHPSTVAVAQHLVGSLDGFIDKYSRKAGVVTSRWGYRDLALTIGFEHGIPDSTLPLYWHVSDTWTPLRRRR